MARLKLHLLGTFEATLDDAILDGLRSDRVRALLAFLATEGTHHHRREYLVSLLWGEFPEKSARANLRVSLANLRQALTLLDQDADPASILMITRQNVRLNVEHKYCWIDCNVYDKLLAACDVHIHVHSTIVQCPECIERLTQAIHLYRGSFLSGLTLPNSSAFDEWRLFQQETRHQKALSALSTLTNYHLHQNNLEQAQHYALRQIDLEPWREEAYRQLMQILVVNGQRNSALAQYDACRRILAQQLDTEPSIETTMLYEQIKAGKFAPASPTKTQYQRPNIPQHNLPAQTTPFVGRAKELKQVNDKLRDPDCRLLSLIGPGGIGKTRLALQAATSQLDTFTDGVYLLSLIGVDTVGRLTTGLAQTLGFSFYQGQSRKYQLQQFLREKELLLILDSFEGLLTAATTTDHPKNEALLFVVDLLRYAPALNILVASRERLNVQGEWLVPVGGLDYPSNGMATAEAFSQAGAVELFSQSARRVQPNYTENPADLPYILKICQLVDGMPLAIELAAAWLRVLSCQEVVQELQNSLDFLTSNMQDLPERHRSLRAVFDYSWQRLTTREKQVYCRLSVFGSDFDRLAAENISDAAPLDLVSLVDKSLLSVTSFRENGLPARYAMHDLLHRYSADKLDENPDEAQRTRQNHSQYYLLFLQQAQEKLKSRQQLEALQAIELEIENIQQSWHWAITNRTLNNLDQALESLFLFYYMRSWFQEGETEFGKLLKAYPQPIALEHQTILNKARVCYGWFLFHLDQQETALTLLQESLLQLQQLEAPAETAFCLGYLGAMYQHQGAYDAACHRGRECLQLYRELGDTYGVAMALNILGRVAFLQGRSTEAKELYQESLDLHRGIGDQWGIAFSLEYLGQIAFACQEYQTAQTLFEESLATRQTMGDIRGTAQCYNYLGNTVGVLGNKPKARQFYQDALELFEKIGHQTGIAQSLANLEQSNS